MTFADDLPVSQQHRFANKILEELLPEKLTILQGDIRGCDVQSKGAVGAVSLLMESIDHNKEGLQRLVDGASVPQSNYLRSRFALSKNLCAALAFREIVASHPRNFEQWRKALKKEAPVFQAADQPMQEMVVREIRHLNHEDQSPGNLKRWAEVLERCFLGGIDSRDMLAESESQEVAGTSNKQLSNSAETLVQGGDDFTDASREWGLWTGHARNCNESKLNRMPKRFRGNDNAAEDQNSKKTKDEVNAGAKYCAGGSEGREASSSENRDDFERARESVEHDGAADSVEQSVVSASVAETDVKVSGRQNDSVNRASRGRWWCGLG